MRARDDGDENGENEDEGATSSMTKTRARDDGDENGKDEDDDNDEYQYEDKGENGGEHRDCIVGVAGSELNSRHP